MNKVRKAKKKTKIEWMHFVLWKEKRKKDYLKVADGFCFRRLLYKVLFPEFPF